MDPEEEVVVDIGAEVEGDGDADDRDEDGNVEDDVDVSIYSSRLFPATVVSRFLFLTSAMVMVVRMAWRGRES